MKLSSFLAFWLQLLIPFFEILPSYRLPIASSLESQLSSLRESHSQLSLDNTNLRVEVGRLQQQHKFDLEKKDAEHQLELERVDGKVRALLGTKDATINKLKGLLSESEARRTEKEKVVLELNSNLSRR